MQQGTDPKDLFAFKINYNTISSGISGVTALYNGNIAETQWTSSTDNMVRTYGYKYDALNRLNDALYKKGSVVNAYDEKLTYDANGNIKTLTRFGSLNDTTPVVIDELTYAYKNVSSNQLMKVVDARPNDGSFRDEFKDSATNTVDDYDYDANGNMTKDNNKNITAITYNHLNLPTQITFGSAGNISYIYNATGQKVQKVVVEPGKTTITTDYLGGYQYSNAAFKFFPTAEGYVEPVGNSYKYVYQYKDHLGNVRLSYDKTLVIQEENNYYPFGLKHSSYSVPIVVSTNDALKYRFQDKEWQDELGLNWYDFGGRSYMPDIVRTPQNDPLAEKFYDVSPQSFLSNNPLRFIDPTGMASEDSIDPPGKKTAWQQSYNPKTGNHDVGKYALLKTADFIKSINTYVKEKISISDKEITSTATAENGGGENQKTKGKKTGDNINAGVFLIGAPGAAKTGNNLKSVKEIFEAGNDIKGLFDKGQQVGEGVKEEVKANRDKREKQNELIYVVKDDKNPNRNLQMRREDFEAQQKKNRE